MVSAALNAVNAVIASLDCWQTDAVDGAAEASSLVIETIYQALARVIPENDAEMWSKTDAHPVIRRELDTQDTSLDALRRPDGVSRLRSAAPTESDALLRDLLRLLFIA